MLVVALSLSFDAHAQEVPCAEGFGRAADGNCYPLATSLPPVPPPAPPVPAAAPVDPLGRDRAYWLGVNQRARGVVTAGWVTGGAGLALDALGLATYSPELIGLGGLAEAIGAPMIAGGSLRASRAVIELGGTVPRQAGYAAWGLWGGGLALNIGSYAAYDETTYYSLALGGLACRVTSYVLGGVQAGKARRVERGLPSRSVGLLPLRGGGAQVVLSVQ